MQRIKTQPRFDAQHRVESLGLVYHTTYGKPYWNESAYYQFTAAEIDVLEAATNVLWDLCLQAAEAVITQNRFAELAIPESAVPLIISSWEKEPPSIYGRFDLAYDGFGHPKMLEFNADTPTGLLEAAVVQWYWFEELHSGAGADQFNSIWEKLVAKWRELFNGQYLLGSPVHFAHMPNTEDLMTVSVLRDTAQEAGIRTEGIEIAKIGWHSGLRCFVDLEERPIRSLFKLYPWEWLIAEEFAPQLIETHERMQIIEPAWKMLLSNKGILPILWELFPGHPNLLASYFGGSRDLRYYAKKPLLSREGANVTLKTPDGLSRQGGEYGEEGYVFQELASVPDFDGNRPIIGSWLVTDQGACGIGIRESDGLITDNLSRFVPHIFY